ncbi:MAG: flagellin [Bacillota bacterium]|nr:flagellin [Bacillota bacterium]
MRINNNVMAMNAHRQLGVNSRAQGKSIEKLSSGFRINRAGDDAAGLAISEKMRSQVRGLNKASRNAQDDISLIQTTEGALNETHAIIHRMREMAVQSSNDSNTDADREALQAEMDQLAQEITRIANDTEFNTRKVLNGNLDKNTVNSTGDITFHIGANKGQNMKFGVSAMDAKSLGLTEDKYEGAASGPGVKNANISRAEQSKAIKDIADGKTVAEREIAITKAAGNVAGNKATTAAVQVGEVNGATTAVSASFEAGATGEKYNDIKIRFATGAGAHSAAFDAKSKTLTVTLQNTQTGVTSDDVTNAIKAIGTKVEGYDFTNAKVTLTGGNLDASKTVKSDLGSTSGGVDKTIKVTATKGGITESVEIKESEKKVEFNNEFKGLSFETDDANKIADGGAVKIELNVEKSAEATFNANHSVKDAAKVSYGINILTQGSADAAIERIDSALKKVSDVRAGLGAVQNRLEHTIKNVDTAAENLQASESRIRDVDMAKEMMNYTKNNILSQAAQSMLAQANQLPQGVLQLLR